MTRPERPTVDAASAIKFLRVVHPPVSGSMYIVAATTGDLMRVLGKLSDAGYAGGVDYWPIKDRLRHGLPGVCAFVSFHPAADVGGWHIIRGSDPTPTPETPAKVTK